VKHKKLPGACFAVIAACIVLFSATAAASARVASGLPGRDDGPRTTTPIKHLVVLFDENVSFDHYFGTYPSATNPAGEPRFSARPGTPAVNGLTPALLTDNPNLANPQRLDRSLALTCVTQLIPSIMRRQHVS